MDRLQALKSIAHGEPVSKSANLAEIMEIGMIGLMLHNVFHNRASDDDGPDFDKSDMEGMFGAIEKAMYGAEKSAHLRRKKKKTKKSLLEGLKALLTKAEGPSRNDRENIQTISTAPPLGEFIAKSIDEEKGLITAVILRPNIADLHGDIYDAEEVAKACFNFNTRCMRSNIQHEKMADFEFVESFIVKADASLGEGEVLKGDWIGTMHIDPQHNPDVWSKVKSGEFTGFSVGCKATVEEV